MKPLRRGDHGPAARRVQNAINTRLSHRDADGHKIKADAVIGPKSIVAARFTYYLLGGNLEANFPKGSKVISVEVQRTIRDPRSRTDAEKERGKRRLKKHRAAVKRAEKRRQQAGAKRQRIVANWEKAASNYRADPSAYHYLAGGIANLVILRPTPRNWRSDCSQFIAGGYDLAGVSSPAAPLAGQWASTYSIVKSPHARITNDPKPGDLGMYGDRSGPLASRNTHHVEGYVGKPGRKFIGHGGPPIDSLTPGEPDFYVTFDFLD